MTPERSPLSTLMSPLEELQKEAERLVREADEQWEREHLRREYSDLEAGDFVTRGTPPLSTLPARRKVEFLLVLLVLANLSVFTGRTLWKAL